MNKPLSALPAALLLFISVHIHAGGDNRPAGARSAALAHSSVALDDLWSAFNNQAGLALLSTASAGIYYENRFMLKELGYKAAAIALPVKPGTIGISFNHFGYSAFNESKIGLAFARSFGQLVSFGLQLNYNMCHLDESYGNRNFVTFEAGMLATLTSDLTLGAHVYNPANAKIAEYNDERAPVVFRIGLAYNLTEKIKLLAETQKSSYTDAFLNAAVEYNAWKQLFLRGGVSTGQTAFTFGLGYHTGKFCFDLSSCYHNILGYSPQVSVSYKF